MTATLDNSKKLYELTGWETDRVWATNGSGLKFIARSNDGELGHDIARICPAYDSDYLLEKLPATIGDSILQLEHLTRGDGTTFWRARYIDGLGVFTLYATADTPADALCLLAIKLKEEGVM